MPIGPDRIQVLKQESSALGGDGAEDVVYPSPISPQEDAIEAAGLYLQDAGNRDESVYVERSGGDLRFVDASNPGGLSLSQLAAGGSGLTEGQHDALDTFAHELAEDSDTEVQRSGGQVSAVIVWTSFARTQKIRETLITRVSGQVSSVVTRQYDGAGSLKATYIETVTRGAGRVNSISGVRV